MSGHLSAEQISSWLIGEHGRQEQAHLEVCGECQGRVARMEGALSQFRSSARHWSGELDNPVRYRERAQVKHNPGRWMLAAAVLLVLLAAPLYQGARERRRATEQAEADTILLERVDRAVSRAVPRPMEPLVELVSWGPDPAKGNEKK